MAADISKSLVHIQERFIQRGQITKNVAVPTVSAAAGSVTVTGVTGVKVGDFVIAQPTASTDVISGIYVTNAYVTAADTVKIEVFGTGTGATKSYTFTVFGSGF